MKKLGLFGSTGSIGENVLNVVRHNPEAFEIVCLTANHNVQRLAEQALEFRPQSVCICSEEHTGYLKDKLAGTSIRITNGHTGLVDLARNESFDMMVGAIVGSAGLLPTIEAIKTGKNIALANKETLVVAGEVVNHLLEKHKVDLIPIDSEHSALFQCLVGESNDSVKRLILTASGGPFLHTPLEEFETLTVESALKHPNWNMGAKITVDSATMMNKGLEVIEAHWLFQMPAEKIDVIIHPQSIIHSMVEFVDGSIKSQMGLPDMKLPIQYALTYPGRIQNGYECVDFTKYNRLDFFQPDTQKFPCLRLAYEALKTMGTMPAVLNAANEVAVSKFLKREIGFNDIPRSIEKAMTAHTIHPDPSLDDVVEADRWAREFCGREIKNVKMN
ncbi:1-deoxy-D-xylulose-5-phosphate reductoisomerase [bacterium]|nr:1-deoxy-D-xylulose-5-phosphate reductoisomerase [bacterium]